MASKVNAGILRFPHTESLYGKAIELSDGSTLEVEEVTQSLGIFNADQYEAWDLPIIRYIAAREVGYELTAVPVFTTRRFVQWMVEVPINSNIHEPKDLNGKKIIQNYIGNTDQIWAKGLFEDTYGADLSDVTWYTLHEELVPGSLPVNVICVDGAQRDDLVLDGTVDAALTSGHPNPLRPNLRYMFADPEAEAAEWYKTYPIFPMLHVLVVRNSALAEHKNLGQDLYRIFDDAKTEALEKWDYGASLPEEQRAGAIWSGFPGGVDRPYLDRDPIPYGLDMKANRDALEQLMRYGVKFGAIRKTHPLEEIFPTAGL